MQLSKDEREEIILILSLRTNYSEDLLRKMSDEELLEIYNKQK